MHKELNLKRKIAEKAYQLTSCELAQGILFNAYNRIQEKHRKHILIMLSVKYPKVF